MAEAATRHGVPVERISFKGSVDTVRHFSLVIARATSRRQRRALTGDLLAALAGDPVPARPERVEPRSQKRRPKAYPSLVRPRAVMKARLLRRRRTAKSGS